jgi:hypothetical protein
LLTAQTVCWLKNMSLTIRVKRRKRCISYEKSSAHAANNFLMRVWIFMWIGDVLWTQEKSATQTVIQSLRLRVKQCAGETRSMLTNRYSSLGKELNELSDLEIYGQHKWKHQIYAGTRHGENTVWKLSWVVNSEQLFVLWHQVRSKLLSIKTQAMYKCYYISVSLCLVTVLLIKLLLQGSVYTGIYPTSSSKW